MQWTQCVYRICQNSNVYIAKMSYVCTLTLETFQLFNVNLLELLFLLIGTKYELIESISTLFFGINAPIQIMPKSNK